MNKICFVLDCHYENYTKRLKSTSLKQYIEYGLNNLGIGFLITTNRPKDFKEYSRDNILIYDINKLREKNSTSLKYEILPENPVGIYPSRFPWNLERFGLKKAGELGYNVVINLDSDVVFNQHFDGKFFVEYIDKVFEKNTVKTNQGIFTYEKNSLKEIFYLHEKYINHFKLNFENHEYNSLDGPVVVYMGESNEDIIKFSNLWDELSNFGYEKKYGFGYEGIVCGNWSLAIPMSGFKLKWCDFPFTPHHKFEDRY